MPANQEQAARRDDGSQRGKAAVAAAADSSRSDPWLAERNTFRMRLARMFGMQTEPPSLVALRIGLGATEDIAVELRSRSIAQVLQIAGARLASAVRVGDVVTRVDAEGFACLLVDLASREQLMHLACKVLDLLSEPMQIEDRQISISPSIGIAICPEDGATAAELLKTAGDAMRRAQALARTRTRTREIGYTFSDARAGVRLSQWATLTVERRDSNACR